VAFPCASLREFVPIPPPRQCPSPGCRAIARGNSIASMAPGPEIRMHHCLIIALARLTTRNLRPGSPFPLARGFVPRRRWLSIGKFDPEDTSSSGFARNDRSFGVSHCIPGVIGMRSAQGVRQRILLHRNCYEMDMIAHQAIAPPAHGVPLPVFAQQLQVFVGMENDSPPIASLCHVMRQSHRNHTRDSTHRNGCGLLPDLLSGISKMSAPSPEFPRISVTVHELSSSSVSVTC